MAAVAYRVSVITREGGGGHNDPYDPGDVERFVFSMLDTAQAFRRQVQEHTDYRVVIQPIEGYISIDEAVQASPTSKVAQALARATDPNYSLYLQLKERYEGNRP